MLQEVRLSKQNCYYFLEVNSQLFQFEIPTNEINLHPEQTRQNQLSHQPPIWCRDLSKQNQMDLGRGSRYYNTQP